MDVYIYIYSFLGFISKDIHDHCWLSIPHPLPSDFPNGGLKKWCSGRHRQHKKKTRILEVSEHGKNNHQKYGYVMGTIWIASWGPSHPGHPLNHGDPESPWNSPPMRLFCPFSTSDFFERLGRTGTSPFPKGDVHHLYIWGVPARHGATRIAGWLGCEREDPIVR